MRQRTDEEGAWEAWGTPLDARPFFARSRSELIDLLDTLAPDEWHRPTAAAPWTVHDVVAHLLGDDVGRISRARDQYVAPGGRADESLPQLVHRLNDEWVRATARISPRLLVDLLRTTTPQVMGYWQEADLAAQGPAVSWAGLGEAPVWLDCARDFTEDWVHQQQIRQAVGQDSPDEPDVLHAVLETFLRAVPYTLDHHAPEPGTAGRLAVTVPGAAGGTWTWRRADGGWVWTHPSSQAATSITLDADDLWKLCVRMIEPAEAATRAIVRGDAGLALAALRTVSIIR
jgi:uncharacterized protein (TIGR03083 family)